MRRAIARVVPVLRHRCFGLIPARNRSKVLMPPETAAGAALSRGSPLGLSGAALSLIPMDLRDASWCASHHRLQNAAQDARAACFADVEQALLVVAPYKVDRHARTLLSPLVKEPPSDRA